jgi:hypothetical protein
MFWSAGFRRRLSWAMAVGNNRPPTFPSCGFIAAAMGLAMMAPAQRHGELVADLAPERAVLRDAKGWASDGRHYTATLSLSPSARITFRTVANSGFPSVESAL